MFEKVSQTAEQLAMSASRREFLGRFGTGALVAAVAIGGILAIPAAARAGRQPRACGASSEGSCIGANVGDPCSTERSSGVCSDKPAHDGVCYCAVKNRRG
jgi:hypothetical protein